LGYVQHATHTCQFSSFTAQLELQLITSIAFLKRAGLECLVGKQESKVQGMNPVDRGGDCLRRTLTPSVTLKKPSGVRSPVQNTLSPSSMSLVSRVALSASVRAISTVGVPCIWKHTTL